MSYNHTWDPGSFPPVWVFPGDSSIYTLPPPNPQQPSTNAAYMEPFSHDLYGGISFTENSNNQLGPGHWRDFGVSDSAAQFSMQRFPPPCISAGLGYPLHPPNSLPVPSSFSQTMNDPLRDVVHFDTSTHSVASNAYQGSQNSYLSVPPTPASSNTEPFLTTPAKLDPHSEITVNYKLVQRLNEQEEYDIMEYLNGDLKSRPCRQIFLGKYPGRRYYTDDFLNYCVVIMDHIVGTKKPEADLGGLWEFYRRYDGFLQEAVVWPVSTGPGYYWSIILSPYPAGTVRGLLAVKPGGEESMTEGEVSSNSKPRLPRLLPKKPS